MSRTEYHRDYYRRNIHKRRRQRIESKQRCKFRSEVIRVGDDASVVGTLMQSWRRA